jgi:glutaminyl-tRNA synthetase
VHVKYYENSKSGEDTSGIKAKGVLHWVSCEHAFDAEVRLYDRLFSDPAPDGHKDKDFMEFINPDSLEVLQNCKLEPSLKDAKEGDRFQFQRMGYFCVDSKYSKDGAPVFNRTVTLKDTWAKLTAK